MRLDGETFDQIAAELLANAAAYGAAPIEIRAAADPDRFVLAVRDHGRGVAPEFVPRMFDPFTRSETSRRRRKSGRGLGLASVREHAEALGGRVAYTGGFPGAEFVVELPPTLVVDAAATSGRPGDRKRVFALGGVVATVARPALATGFSPVSTTIW